MHLIRNANSPRYLLGDLKVLVLDDSLHSNHGISRNKNRTLFNFFRVGSLKFVGENNDFVRVNCGPFN